MPSRTRQVTRTRRPLIALVALLALLAVGYVARNVQVNDRQNRAVSSSSAAPAQGEVALSSLPLEAQRTVALIRAGGPFPYSRDGVVFGNEEGRLPHEPYGYYHEYTVATPGLSTRGARRMLTGKAGEFYYTADHYETFQLVDVDR